MKRISFGLALTFLCATGALAACDAESPADVPEAVAPEPTSEAAGALTIEECGEECEDSYADDRETCLRLGYEKPKNSSCPGGVSASDPSRCAGLNELCGSAPPPWCHPSNASCVPLDPTCVSTYIPGLAAVCEPAAQQELESCVSDCLPPPEELIHGQSCLGIRVLPNGSVKIVTGTYNGNADACEGSDVVLCFGGGSCHAI